MVNKNKNWLVKFSQKLTVDKSPKEILQILLDNRGIKPAKMDEFIKPQTPRKITPRQVGIKAGQIKKAVQIIKSLGQDKKIIIYGDYDVDGLTSTAIVWEALWNKNYNVVPFIPDREEDGYGLNPDTVKKLKKDYPDMAAIITVDNGIVAFDGVAAAKDLGLRVIITDHHLPADQLPAADAIIHSTKLSGAGVAWFLAKEFGARSFDLAAIGTIADLVPLIGVNRSFVKFGLKELCFSKRIGLRLLKDKAGIRSTKEILPWQISFLIAPRLNAAGRLDQAIDGLRLICTNDSKRARDLVEKLDKINRQRQDLTTVGLNHALSHFIDDAQLIIIAADKSYHPGVVGLIAGKLVEAFFKPAIAISKGKIISKGSARSVAGVNIVDLIKTQKELLINVGGHELAAGFSLKTRNLDKFIKNLQKQAEKIIDKKYLTKEIKVDAEIDFSLISKKFYSLIQRLAPFGFGNPEPTFLLKNARIIKVQALGKEEKHLKLYLDDPKTEKEEKIVAEAIGFGLGEWQNNLAVGDLIDLIFSIDINYWSGKETIQLKVKDLKKAD